ncbi:MAG: protein kinase [Deltaproteobacteria bacterium]|nr:protein kinase [Deltaproteobacteria bacterium]
MVTPDDFDATLHPSGTIIGRYRIVRTLGEGGMGSVYEAVHLDLEKRVALKILRPEVARVADSRARFLREGRTAASIHHAHVVEVFDVGQEGASLYLVMEYLEGENLYEHLYRAGALPVAACVDLLLPVCGRARRRPRAGASHRDVKPENVFLARTRHGALQSKLLDFRHLQGPAPRRRPAHGDVDPPRDAPLHVPRAGPGGRLRRRAQRPVRLRRHALRVLHGPAPLRGRRPLSPAAPSCTALRRRGPCARRSPPPSRPWCSGRWLATRPTASPRCTPWAPRCCPSRASPPRRSGARSSARPPPSTRRPWCVGPGSR